MAGCLLVFVGIHDIYTLYHDISIGIASWFMDYGNLQYIKGRIIPELLMKQLGHEANRPILLDPSLSICSIHVHHVFAVVRLKYLEKKNINYHSLSLDIYIYISQRIHGAGIYANIKGVY